MQQAGERLEQPTLSTRASAKPSSDAAQQSSDHGENHNIAPKMDKPGVDGEIMGGKGTQVLPKSRALLVGCERSQRKFVAGFARFARFQQHPARLPHRPEPETG